MDRKSIIVIAACMVTLVLWVTVIIPKFTPQRPPTPAGTTNSSVVKITVTNLEEMEGQLKAALNSIQPSTVVRFQVATNTPEELLEVTNEAAHYTFTSYGGGLKMVELLDYPETIARSKKDQPASRVAALNAQSPAPTLAVLDGDAVQGDGIFSLAKTATGVRAEKTLTNGLTLVKEFSLSTNYLMTAMVRLENHSAQALALPDQKWIVGTATPMSIEDNGQAVGVLWYDGAKSQDVSAAYFANKTLGCFPGTPRSEYLRGQSNVVWAAVHNQFFALVAMPKDPAGEVLVQNIALPKPSIEDISKNSRLNRNPEGYVTALIYPAVTIQPNQSVQREFTLFAGPKEYQTLARIAAQFNNNVDLVMGYSGFFGFFSKGLLLAMNWVHGALSLPYGWAIIAITVIIKLVFWPLTAASTRSMKRMQALQPQMKAIAEKYKDDPVKKNQKTMQFMKENKVSPLGGCLPMALQMPIFFGFYRMIQSAIELRGAHFLWVTDLSKPDTLFMIPGTNFPFNLLPLIMGGTMLWQAHLTPPSPGVDPAQQKIMKYMPLMFLVILYNFSAGLALYWTVSNLLTILQTKLTRMQPVAAVLTPVPKKSK
jgi:YidC/Oxa1 family membrane protein insertase